MAKLSNKIEYYNPGFDESFGEYLICNKFSCHAEKDILHFIKGNKKVVVYKDSIDVFTENTDHPVSDSMKWIFTGTYIELSTLDFFGFISLMHDMGVVSVLKFLKDEKEKGPQYYTEAKLILNQLQ